MSKLIERQRDQARGVTSKPNPQGAKAAASALVRAIEHGPKRGDYRDVPGLGRVWIELLGQRAAEDVDFEVHKIMRERELPLDVTTANLWEGARAVRYLAQAVRDPDDHGMPFGSLEEWGELDAHIINAAWHAYGDVEEHFDPMLVGKIEPQQIVEIRDAIAKKNYRLLMSFGAHTLASFMLTTELQPETSQTPRSTSGLPSSDSSASTHPQDTRAAGDAS